MKTEKNFLYKKTVVISGASGGIGFSIAKLLIEKYDCKIIGIARNETKILNAINTLDDKKSNFIYKLFDVRNLDGWKNFADFLVKNNCLPDIIINNAGFMLPFTKLEKLSDEQAESIIATNFTSYVYSIKTLLPLIKKSKTPAIINVASSAGLMPVVGEAMYCSTKYAVRGLTQTLAIDYNKKIYIAGVYPGFIKTDLFLNMGVTKENMDTVNKFTMPVEVAAKKIVKAISKKKKNIVIGKDGKFLAFMGKLFPYGGAKLAAKILKSSNLDLFKDAFSD